MKLNLNRNIYLLQFYRNISNQSYLFLLYVIAFTLPFYMHITSIAIALLVIVALLDGNFKAKFYTIATSQTILLFSSLYFLHILGLIYTRNIGEGLFELEQKLSLLVLPLVIGTSRQLNRTQLMQVLFCFISACLVASITCLVIAFYKYFNNIPPTTSVFGGYIAKITFLKNNPGISVIWEYITYTELTSAIGIHPTYFSIYILFCVYIIVATFPKFSLIRINFFKVYQSRIVLIILGIYFTLFLFLLTSKTIIGIFFLINLFYLSFYSIKNKKPLLIAFVIVLAAIVSIAIINLPMLKFKFIEDLNISELRLPPPQTPFADIKAISIRLIHWSASWLCIKENYLIGVGTGDVQDCLNVAYQKIGFDNFINFNSHNQYLQFFIGLGLLGCVLFLMCLSKPLVEHIIGRNNKDDIYLIFTLIIFLACATESVLETQKGIVFYTFFSSLFAFNKSQ